MGYTFSWVAVRGQVPGDLFDQLGLVALSDRRADTEPDFIAAASRGGWVIVAVRDICPGYPNQADLLKRLSRDCELIACYESTYGPESAAAAWKNGRLLWKVEHRTDGDRTPADIACEGDLPPSFEEILTVAQTRPREYTDVDHLYEVPIDLAKAVTGFRQDEDVRGARPPISLDTDVEAFSLVPVEYTWCVTGLESRDQVLRVVQQALHPFHLSEFPGTRLGNVWDVDDDGRWWTKGSTEPAVTAISGFDRWRPEFEATLARRVAEFAPQASLSMEWKLPDTK
ncbi:hypothetical protein AB0L57_04050 [Nocardia sp. NPDC052254]|uniref:hypothetical protein n=1 Tax=Nocardia sp. NPDC052254 TaxID=3155681 RepID=UPI003434D44B